MSGGDGVAGGQDNLVPKVGVEPTWGVNPGRF